MAISTTYILLQRAIADELGNRTDLLAALSDSSLTLSPIQNAIQSAIAKWERESFYFNEIYNSATPLFTTVAAQELYTTADNAGIATAPDIYSLHALINSNRWPLIKRTWEWMEDAAVNPAARGQPSDWAYMAKTIRLYPIPDGAYPIRASRLQVLTALSADADANVWTQDGYDLIRCEAKLMLAQEVLHDEDMARRMKIAIYGDPAVPSDRGYLGVLKAETTRRAATRRVKATVF
jgi:hypothetical protein